MNEKEKVTPVSKPDQPEAEPAEQLSDEELESVAGGSHKQAPPPVLI